MSETGQPGAATPGEHGDGTGRQDDLGRAGSGWAPLATGWSRSQEAAGAHEHPPAWGPPETGWAASSPRHGDLPSPLPGPPPGAEPPARANGHHVNGVGHPDDAPAGRQAPVSAPPGTLGEQRRDPGGDRLMVPAQRPAPAAEQPSLPQPGPAEPEAGSTRPAPDEPSTGRRARWAEPGLPTSAPPAVQVPPVGTAASGFEVPPGFHAPTADRAAEEAATAAGAHGWADQFPPEPPSLAPRPFPPSGERPSEAEVSAGDDRRSGVDRALDADRPFGGEHGAGRFGEEPRSAPFRADHDAVPFRPEHEARAFPEERGADVDRGPVVGQDPATLAGRDRPSDAARTSGLDRAAGLPHASEVARAPGPDLVTGAERGPGLVRAAATDRAPGFGQAAGAERAPGLDRPSGVEGAPGLDRAAGVEQTPGVDRGPGVEREPGGAGRPPAAESDWSGPNWNRPSWGNAWAPPWARKETEPVGRPWDEPEPSGRRSRGDEPPDRRSRDEPAPIARRSREEDEPVGRRSREEDAVGRRFREEDEPTGRRSREEQPPAWAAEPPGHHEPSRAEPPRYHEPSRAEPGHGQEAGWAGAAARAAYEPATGPAGRATSSAADRAVPVPMERPAWAGGEPAGAPVSAPPRPYDLAGPEAATPSGADEDAGRAARPFRLRPVGEERPPATPEGPAATGSAAASGLGRRDRAPSAPAPASAPPYAARRSAPEPVPAAEPAGGDGLLEHPSAALPQRVPAEPDVPVVPEPPAVEPPAETPELARIATHLRRDDEPAPLRERPEGFDVNAILDAVRGVAGVRDAALRRTPAGAHSLRLDLADGADPAEVSRLVARLLQERMGLAAAPQNVPGMPAAPVRRRSVEPRAAEPRSPGSAPPRGGEPASAETRVSGSRRAGGPTEVPQARAEQRPEAAPETPRRRRQSVTPHRGRATVEEPGSVSAAPAGAPPGSPATVGTSYSGGQVTTTESAPSRPLDTGGVAGPRVVIDHVQVSTFGLDATVEVRLVAGGESAAGYSTGPAVDGYVLRLCAVAAAAAVDELLRGGEPGSDRGRCFVEHAAVVPFGNCEVATVVVLLVCDGWVEQLVGSALVAGDPRQAVVRATLAAVNRRIEALLA